MDAKETVAHAIKVLEEAHAVITAQMGEIEILRAEIVSLRKQLDKAEQYKRNTGVPWLSNRPPPPPPKSRRRGRI